MKIGGKVIKGNAIEYIPSLGNRTTARFEFQARQSQTTAYQHQNPKPGALPDFRS